jgi:hypothetical protein
MAKRLIPSLNRVLVEKLLQPKKSAGGILLPETTKQVRGTQISLVSPSCWCWALAPSARDSCGICARAAFEAWFWVCRFGSGKFRRFLLRGRGQWKYRSAWGKVV